MIGENMSKVNVETIVTIYLEENEKETLVKAYDI